MAQSVNASVGATAVVSGPFYVTGTERSPSYHYHNTWEVMYAQDLAAFNTGGDPTAPSRVLGGKLCLWGDAAQTDSGDVFLTAAPYLHGLAEALWSPRNVTLGAPPSAGARARVHGHRCRLGERGFPSHPIIFEAGGAWCAAPFEVALPAWEAQ